MDSFKTLQDTISAALVSTTRSANQLSGADVPFQRSLDPAVGTALDAQNARLLQLAQRLLENAAASSDAVGPKLPDVEAVDGNWKGIVDIIDSLLEKADISLDEYTGVIKRLSPSGDQAAAVKSRPTAPKHIQKPQLAFENPPQNHETGGFKPLITSKPHAKVSLDECLTTFRDSNGREQYPHPYQTEIDTYEYPPSVYQRAEPQPYIPLESVPATFVDTPEALAVMLAELKTAKEIAIDLEHHDNRTYIGLLSLMQISTRDKDWIVDTLKPWRRKLECLNEVFADPNILKVLHGAYMDIVWLQRDLGLYVVGLFDTYHAARSLGYPQASLAYLLDKFTGFKAQKKFQLADWRTRPLTDDLFKYAQADTHFLLYVYDNMRNELIERSNFDDPEQNKIQDVLVKSKGTALQRYEHPVYDVELGLGSAGWYRLLSRTPVHYSPEQFSVFKAVHKWRDDLARAEDESPLFVMPNHAVFSIARNLPKDSAGLVGVVQHLSHILRPRVDELVTLISEAKLAGENGPGLNETLDKISRILYPDRPEIRRKEKPGIDGVSAFLPTLRPAPTVATLDTPAPRTPSSNFWGPLWTGGAAEQRRPMSTLNVNLALPLPPLTAQIFAESGEISNEPDTPRTEKPEHVFVPKHERPPEDERTDIFIVKQLGGRKRKRTDVSEQAPVTPSASGETKTNEFDDDEMMLDEASEEDDEEEELRRKKEAKARRKAAKKERNIAWKKESKRQKALQEGAGNEEQAGYDPDEPAFDYANAPSVLRAREVEAEQSRSGKKKDRKKKDKAFNPYAGLTNAPKGLPRTQQEGPGKSMTFNS